MTRKTSGQQLGRSSWAEPWKIKMVEPLYMISRNERAVALEKAGFNTFLQLLAKHLSFIDPFSGEPMAFESGFELELS